MNNSVDIIEALCYKMRVFGVPIYESTNIFCDNGEVCVKTTLPKSTLSNNHHSIAFHRAREAVMSLTARVSKEHTLTNLDELLTNMMAAPKREGVLIFFYIFRGKLEYVVFLP